MPDDAEDPPVAPVAVVGAGAVGTALALRLADRGYPVRAVLSRTPDEARALADRVGAAVGTDDAAALPADVRLVLLCVPDDAIAAGADRLAALDHPWARTVVGHTSGARTAAVLAPLAGRGAATFSAHPLQTFAPGTGPGAFDDIVVAVEGGEEGVRAGTGLARRLGARPVVLSAAEKARYHCAAALASNGLVALMGVVQEILSSAGVEGEAAALMAPLVEQTWANLKTGAPEGVLTGPVARGDRETVAAHLEALREETPHLVPLYAALSTEMARLAVRSGRLEGEAAEAVLRRFRAALDDPGGGADADPTGR
jgi:predicted short-subunit dehydrogenase-like oxidoreductase (DUF2520 family)